MQAALAARAGAARCRDSGRDARTRVPEVLTHRSMNRTLLITCSCVVLVGCGGVRADRIVVGSKNFTEQAILGELLAQQLEARTHLPVDRRFYLAGTYVCHQAILAGRIDVYVEYTGTALGAILKQSPSNDPFQVYEQVKSEYVQRFHLDVEEPLGFNNTFALVIRGADARWLHVRTISQAAAFAPRWRAGFGYEFMERQDGYQGLVRTYGLRFKAAPRVMDLGLLYKSLLEKQVDIVAGNSTDGLIAARDLAVLEDDRHYFPPYQAVPIMREETLTRHPEVAAAVRQLAGIISDEDMRRMNYNVDGEHEEIQRVARDFLSTKGLN